MEKKVKFESEGLLLEGLLAANSPEEAVVITHPHPLYGGEMHNPVVSTIRGAYFEKGYTTLRFNFRGSGYSQGEHDGGEGEQNDVLSAISYLNNAGFNKITLAGYSFGAWVNLMVASNSTVIEKLVLISPPVDFIEFDVMANVSTLKLVVTGTRDEYASVRHVSKLITKWNKSALFKEIPGADHFYSGNLEKLKEILISQS